MPERRKILAGALAAAVTPLIPRLGRAQDEGAEPEPLPDMVMGDPDAPVEIIEYASMTCPHCASFHVNTLPELKERYIDTGQAKLVFREFPLDRVALMASAVARCADEDRFFPVIDFLFRTQSDWARAENPVDGLKKVVRMGGMDPAMVDECLQNDAVIDGILATRLAGDREFGITATPTLIINGEKFSGALSMEELEEIISPHVTET